MYIGYEQCVCAWKCTRLCVIIQVNVYCCISWLWSQYIYIISRRIVVLTLMASLTQFITIILNHNIFFSHSTNMSLKKIWMHYQKHFIPKGGERNLSVLFKNHVFSRKICNHYTKNLISRISTEKKMFTLDGQIYQQSIHFFLFWKKNIA